MSPAVKDRKDRACRRIDMESDMFKRQCSVNVVCTDRTKCAIRIRVPRNALIHNLSIQVRESSKKSQFDEKNHNILNKWRFVSNREKAYERNLFHLGSEHVHLVGSVDKLGHENLDQFTPLRSHRSPLMDNTNTPPPQRSSIRPSRILRRGGEENMSTPAPSTRRRVPDRSIRLRQSHKSVTIEVRGLTPSTSYDVRVISEALHRGDVTELAVLKLNTNTECDRLHALMCSLNRHEDGVLLCMQGHRISLFRERWPVDTPDMVLYDNGPRNYSIKRLTAGFKGLRLRTEKKRSKEDSSFCTTTSITTTTASTKEDQDKENPLSVLRNRIAAPGVKRSTAMNNIKPLADTTNTITSSSSELASSKSKTNAKIKVSSKASKRDKKKKAARRRRLQRRALNRL
eukprot:g1159.t1